MNSQKNSNHGSQITNGQKIRDVRCLLGLTQLGLAMKVDCSERLIRKMEKSESVSLKSLSCVWAFFRAQGIEVNLNDLVHRPSSTLETAVQWFRERFIEHKIQDDQKWFSAHASLSNKTLCKLSVLDGLAKSHEISVGVAVHHDQNVAITFDVNRRESTAQDPSGSVWMNLTGGKINQLHVMLDSELEQGEVASLDIAMIDSRGKGLETGSNPTSL